MLKQIQARLTKVEAAIFYAYVIVLPITDGSTKLQVGRDCSRLTEQYKEHGVSCHVLPGVNANHYGKVVPTFAIVGPAMANVRKALTAYTGDENTALGMTVTRVPVAMNVQ